MATTTTSNVGSNALGILFDRNCIPSLQPNLYFEQIADVEMVPQGGNTHRFAMFDQIANASVTTLTEGTAPTGVGVTLTVNSITPTQYGIAVEMTDLVVLTAFIDLIKNTAREVGYAVARKIDSVIQTTANAGTNVYYAGGKASRAALGAGDIADMNLIVKAGQKLRKGSAPTFSDGYFRAIGTPEQVYDLKQNTAAGQWLDVQKYAQPGNILNGEVGSVNGTRIMQSGNVDTFSSTVTVHPMIVAGSGGLKVAYWLPQKVKNYINDPEDSNISNPLGQKGSVGAKVNLGASRTQEARLVRIESAATSL